MLSVSLQNIFNSQITEKHLEYYSKSEKHLQYSGPGHCLCVGTLKCNGVVACGSSVCHHGSRVTHTERAQRKNGRTAESLGACGRDDLADKTNPATVASYSYSFMV